MSGTRLIVLAPSRSASKEIADRIGALFAKGDRLDVNRSDDRGLYGDLFEPVPIGWPAAALTRQLDAGDAAGHAWLRADPAHFRVEPGNVRLLVCGDVGQTDDEAAQLHAALAPIFGDEGFELSVPHPHRWYLRAFAGNASPDLPDLPSPEAALGGDLFELWHESEITHRWRRLFNETQIVLAQHPVNQARTQRGLPALNGLWFWGAGRWPETVRTSLSHVCTRDALLAAFAMAAGIDLVVDELPAEADGWQRSLIDLRRHDDADKMLLTILEQWHAGQLRELEWRTREERWQLKRWHRWRFWRPQA